MKFQSTIILVALCIFSTLFASVIEAKPCIQQLNAKDATLLNIKYKKLTENSPCNIGDFACVKGKIAQCVQGKFVLTSCAPTLTCTALPLVNSRGTSTTCDTPQDAASRIKLARKCRAKTG
ncbi:hypothetical protein RclHR1_00440036 [Rhizophagus clarus]|uniref:Proline-rich protein n=1 Tax=Rhizophagus clarus TaxID=94130 RepID=A0A2Z6RYJ5_9GLOM|nr:hypothetical protein RclHR1_00440036 [Rhizophagus clarus]GES93476.1 proline-rich protein [Rhizophagus clarus]